MFGPAAEEDEERRRQRKLEEALEVKSLRRIISAFLNYPEASESNVKRYERSYRKLPPSHKALLSHYPMKFQNLRRCISINSYFIFNMLQAFEPPLDMSQDIKDHENSHVDRDQNGHLLPAEGDDSPRIPISSVGAKSGCHSDEAICRELTTESCEELRGAANHKLPEEEVCIEMIAAYTGPLVQSKGSVENMASSSHDWLNPSIQLDVPLADVGKVRCVIRNIVRDWAAEGQEERDQCYKPILEELDSLFPNRHKEKPPTCLVPGAGLGRLALEISCLGFVSQGNEFSYYMMICSSFILNNSQAVGDWTIYPWIHSNCNSLSDNDQLRPVSIPDIYPASGCCSHVAHWLMIPPAIIILAKPVLCPSISHLLLDFNLLGDKAPVYLGDKACAGITEGFSMCGGDFVEVYGDRSQVGAWDAVMTCFFIDTAHNVIEYIEIISRILKEGGVWINLGPLLYHFADTYGREEMSVELSLEDVKRVALHYGFDLEKESTIETTFTKNPQSMMQNRYYAAFWTMRKKSSNPGKDSMY